MPRISAVVSVLLAALVSASAESNRPPERLVGAKARFDEVDQRITASQKAAELTALGRYREALDEVAKAGKAQGIVSAVVAAQEEKERLLREASVPDTDSASVMQTIVTARSAYRQEIQRIRVEAARQRTKLLAQYVPHLKGIAKELLKSDRLDDAKKVEEELNRAEFMLADAAAKLPPAPSASMTTGSATTVAASASVTSTSGGGGPQESAQG
jgi:hypothetical protein